MTPDQQPQIPKRNKSLLTLIVVGFLCFAVGFSFNAVGAKVYLGAPRQAAGSSIDLSTFNQVDKILKAKFDGDINADKQSEGATAGMVAALGDPYTTYLTPEQNQALSDDLNGELSGIGVEVGLKNGKLTVIAPIDGTPAAKAGLRSGDYIAAINGTDSSGYTLDEAVSKIRGEKGTKVRLTVVRGSEQPKEIEITRDLITVASVTTEVREGNVGYIRIRRFAEETNELITNAAATFKAQGVKGIVLDVRDNPGGYLDSSVEVSSQFVGSGTIVEERSKHSENRKFSALPGGKFLDLPVVMLINGGSASASEITAGALHDTKRATLVGEKTFGKGSVQQVIDLKNGASLKVTIAHWFTPKGVNIGKEGIKPDVEVKLTTDDYNASRDPQYTKAIELIKQKIGQ
jgi:carboxyl-terminal processing protease